ncbi:hypothetical protein EDC22_102399 [Tepidamorphus gemmatus]|uniref:DUF6867 domain-containing protein n=1 Tax=Tepidamorphus gemmatus TaxID=747076 RepID=A0A4V2UZU5_9HYPH|nr:hypothetical protein [Tepidamorphus gemmatus]TCT12713.1 hypothetical protein EDC22_102399 [Tepidamorphus gemmatus]
MGLLWESSFGVFLLVTVCLGGAAAFMTGRAIASTWRPVWQLPAYLLLLAAAARFLHFSLFGGSLLSLHYYFVDLVILGVFGALGFRLMRVRQMVTQYGWLYERAGPFGWRDRRS